ncbi:MAG TPA: hypothetical protein H9884_00580 [Candidatus Yaniella excrementigallinarum]|nr:hypothetical protein [Candidatus Yaniella excrementigallinarum]
MTHHPRPELTRQERRITLFTSGVWLIFLGWTVFGLIESTAALPAQIAGWAALVTFPVVYLSSFLYPTPLTALNRHLNTLAYTAVLVLLGVIMSQATPPAIINIVPYLMAIWIFNHRLPTACIALVILFGAAVVLVNTMGFQNYATWFLAAVGSPAILMLFIRISIHLGETQQYHAEQLTLARQREELASTVHDVLGHSLTTITVKIQLAQRLLATDLAAAKTEMADIESLARRSLSEVRSTVTDLQHPDLAEQLDQAHQALTAAGLHFNRPQRLPHLTLVQQQVFAWVIREAVTNVIRHAQASTCTISFHDVDTQTMLRIDDDGVGITSTECKKHHGLYGLQRRVDSTGGSLKLHHLTPGTRLEVTL